ncbi:MAG TPA: hypothetical protein VGM05_16285 [Planctomycetaceae bacterium]|jgi:hypothetical protein
MANRGDFKYDNSHLEKSQLISLTGTCGNIAGMRRPGTNFAK